MNAVTIGADPEFAIIHKANPTVPIPVCGMLGGTKEKPIPMDFKKSDKNHRLFDQKDYITMMPNGPGYFYHEDGVMAEIAIPPVTTSMGLLQTTARAVNYLRTKLPKDHRLVLGAAYNYRLQDLKKHPQAMEFGCEADFDGYQGDDGQRPPFSAKDFGAKRFLGGHIHIGGDFNCPKFVAACMADVFITLRMMSRIGTNLSPNGVRPISEPAAVRRANFRARAKTYGQPGIYRPKPYGIEYRTLPNIWANGVDQPYYLGEYALQLGNYLTTTSANTIKQHLGLIDWMLVRKAIIGWDVPTAGLAIKQARRVGVFNKLGVAL